MRADEVGADRRDGYLSDERFELLQKLGGGGFALTWHARVLDQELIEDFGTDEVALKIPHDAQKERALRRELEMNASLHHMKWKALRSTNLVRYLGFTVFRNQIVMAMEFVQGGSLRDLIGPWGRQRAISLENVLTIAEGVLEGLRVIHEEHVIHRDIKPENILMDGSTPKIADLGIARLLDDSNLAYSRTGTYPYTSPEILMSQGASFTSDIWSLGVMMYEMLIGRMPFGEPDTSAVQLLEMICKAEPKRPASIDESIPAAVDELIMRSLNKNPEHRFASAAQMLDAIMNARHSMRSTVEEELASIREVILDPDRAVEAEQLLVSIAERHLEDAAASRSLGEFYNRCQRYGDAERAFRHALGIDPFDAMLHWDIALAHQGRGQRVAAARHLRQALDLGLEPSLRRHAKTLLVNLER